MRNELRNSFPKKWQHKSEQQEQRYYNYYSLLEADQKYFEVQGCDLDFVLLNGMKLKSRLRRNQRKGDQGDRP